MTRKKINLDLATEAWMLAEFGGRLSYDLRRMKEWDDSDHKTKAITREIQRSYLACALDIGIDQMTESSEAWGIKFETHASLNAKELHRLMNAEIHLNGAVFVFDDLCPEGHMEGDSYMGEATEYAVHRIGVSYRNAAKPRR